MGDSVGIRTVALPAVINLDALDGVRDSLIDAVEAGSVIIDAGAVERVATNGLLMLISAAETARGNSYDFTISGASAPMRAAIERLGLGTRFDSLMRG